MQQSNLVYCVECECGDKYIGQTKRRLEARLHDHKYHIGVRNINHSALCKHSIENHHVPKWDETCVLALEKTQKKRDILEMIEIKKEERAINKQTDSLLLSNVYNNLIL